MSASPAAMEVAMRKVCVVQEVILAEAQRIERVAAEKAHGAKMLQGVVRDFEAIKGTVEVREDAFLLYCRLVACLILLLCLLSLIDRCWA